MPKSELLLSFRADIIGDLNSAQLWNSEVRRHGSGYHSIHLQIDGPRGDNVSSSSSHHPSLAVSLLVLIMSIHRMADMIVLALLYASIFILV
jgi:hypothetical protein